MSWFGETFGESLTSLKGQITKITKEVLAEDNENDENTESVQLRVKELNALCLEKDHEIQSLHEENQKVSHRFLEEIKFLRNENQKLKTEINERVEKNFLVNDDEIKKIKNELHELRFDKNNLEQSLKDYQCKISILIQERDSYKQKLQDAEEYRKSDIKHSEVIKYQNESVEGSSSNCNLSEVEIIEQKTRESLEELVERLQSQIKCYEDEREETTKRLENEVVSSEKLKLRIEKLMEEIMTLNSEKDDVELENLKLKDRIDLTESNLHANTEVEKLKIKHLEENLKKLTEELEVKRLEHEQLESQVKKLLNIMFTNNNEDHSNFSMSDFLSKIENLWVTTLSEKETLDKKYSNSLYDLEKEMEKLKYENSILENKIKAEIEIKMEMESEYKKEINTLQNKCLELESQNRDSIIKSQTDDVKRLDQELSRLIEVVDVKNSELSECYARINAITEELNTTKNIAQDGNEKLRKVLGEQEQLEKKVIQYESSFNNKDKELQDMIESIKILENKNKSLSDENLKFIEKCTALDDQLNKALITNQKIESAFNSVRTEAERASALEKELENNIKVTTELEKLCADMQQIKLSSDNQMENLKAQLIIKESALTEVSMKNQDLVNEMTKLKEELVRLKSIEEELNQWKETMIELEIQRQDLLEKKEILENECQALKLQLTNFNESKEPKIFQPREASGDDVYSKTIYENQIEQIRPILSNYDQSVSVGEIEIQNMDLFRKQEEIIAHLTKENNELREYLQRSGVYEQTVDTNTENNELTSSKMEIIPLRESASVVNEENEASLKKAKVHHKRSKSELDAIAGEDTDVEIFKKEIQKINELLQHQIQDNRVLQEQYSILSEKESHARKELERLRLHLIEIENYYTETIDEYKTKLNVTEEQLKNSSTFYTSNKVRDNQHLESLQSQIRLISAQRDDLQVKLSAAEDEVQKHKAALTSFHVVLEQFQQDKDRECEGIALKYENQLNICEKRITELQQEIESLNNQLSEAKTGLKAASRLGEQLDKKSEQIAELEHRLMEMKNESKKLEETASLANQSNFGKVDKSLVKNLLLGYISSQKPDRKEQVLRIMMSVLDFNEEERNRSGIDNNTSWGWLSTLLHPKGDIKDSSQSLSEAFIRFLENESRPQPQLKLLPEHSYQKDKPRSATSTPKPSLLLQELVLPTFNSPQANESTILKDVLNDS